MIMEKVVNLTANNGEGVTRSPVCLTVEQVQAILTKLRDTTFTSATFRSIGFDSETNRFFTTKRKIFTIGGFTVILEKIINSNVTNGTYLERSNYVLTAQNIADILTLLAPDFTAAGNRVLGFDADTNRFYVMVDSAIPPAP